MDRIVKAYKNNKEYIVGAITKEEYQDLKDNKLDVSAYTDTWSGVSGNYYTSAVTQAKLDLKQDILTAGTGIDISGNVISCTLDPSIFKVVTELPTENIKDNIIYLVPAPSSASGATNIYIEYLYIKDEAKWEKIGEYQGEVDLSDYYKKTETDDLLDEKLFVSAYTDSWSGVSGNYYTSAVTQDLLDKKLDISAYTDSWSGVSGNYYTSAQTETRLDDKLDVSAYTDSWSGVSGNYYTSAVTQAKLDLKQEKINFNGEDKLSGITFYAPTTSGTSGYTLQADENGVPVWVSAATVDLSGYTPLSSFTSAERATAEALTELHNVKLDISAYTATSDSWVSVSGNYYTSAVTQDLLDDKLDISAYTDSWSAVSGNYYTSAVTQAKLDEKEGKINFNGEDILSGLTFYAPTSAGTSGYTLQADADGIPVWVSGSSASVNLNGEDTTEAKFYAPLSGGTSGQTLISNGDGKAPEWKDALQAVSLTKAEYSALTETEKNDPLKLYTITDDDAVSYPLQDIYDMLHPVGEVVFGVSAPNVPTSVTATWEVASDFQGKALWVDNTQIGVALDGSLPNITGDMDMRYGVSYIDTFNGAYYKTGTKSTGWAGGGSSTMLWGFDASLSNSVYSASAGENVVRPTSTGIGAWVRTA